MGLKDILSKLTGKEDNQMENNQIENITKTYTSKPGTLEAAVKKGMSAKAKMALAAALAVGAIALSGMAPSDAHAAGAAHHMGNKQQIVVTASDIDINSGLQQIDQFQNQYDAHDNFLNRLNPDNRMYDQSSRVNNNNYNNNNIRNTHIHGDATVGEIIDGR